MRGQEVEALPEADSYYYEADPIYDFFEACQATWVGSTIQESLWLFPVIESFHLVTFAILGGCVLLVDLRILGLVMKNQTLRELADSARPWLTGSLIATIISGVLLFMSEAVKCYYNDPFWAKMRFLGLAILFTFTVRNRIIGDTELRAGPLFSKIVAVLSILLWSGVAWGGRWIGFWG
ncbi:MAG: DUF6644 family protein [Acidobacteriota bacterium]